MEEQKSKIIIAQIEKELCRKTKIPLLNDFGLQAVKRWLRVIINSNTVQGNLSKNDFKVCMKYFHNLLAIELIGNKYEYGIKTNGDLKSIINTITYFLRLFLSRTIENGKKEAMKVISKETYCKAINEKNNNLYTSLIII